MEVARLERPGGISHSLHAELVAAGRPAYVLALRIVRSAEDAKDVVQQAYLNACAKLRDGQPPHHVREWFLAVVANVAKNHRRSSVRRTRREAVMQHEDRVASSEVDRELVSTLRKAIDGLDAQSRALVSLCYEQGFSQREAARILNLPFQTVSKRIHRGLEELRKILKQAGYASVPALVIEALTRTAPDLPASLEAFIKNLPAAPSAAVAATTTSMTSTGKVIATVILVGFGVGAVAVYQSTFNHDREEVYSGEAAVADASGLFKLSPADAWLRELLVRAETGPWDAVNFGKGTFSQGPWRLDARGSAAERRVWNVEADATRGHGVTFDQPRWTRGVVTASVMLLALDQRPPELPVREAAATPPWFAFFVGSAVPRRNTGPRFLLYRGSGEATKCALISWRSPAPMTTGVWYRFVLYFDLEAEDGPWNVTVCWPEGTSGPPPAAQWWESHERGLFAKGERVGLGLYARDCRILAKAIKFVPLGPDLPQPPSLAPAAERAP